MLKAIMETRGKFPHKILRKAPFTPMVRLDSKPGIAQYANTFHSISTICSTSVPWRETKSRARK